MWSVIKLVVNAFIGAAVTATAFAMLALLALWGANGFPSATLADLVALLGQFGTVGTVLVLALKLTEFAWVVRTLDKHGRAFDSAFDRLYKSLAERDVESARYWLSKLESRQQPLYSILSHCAKWRGTNTAVIDSMQWQVIERPRVAREDIARSR
jgi:hypothetical protein